MKLYYIANARMPTEKAHGIQIAKMCEAFVEAGIDLTLILPNRNTVPESIREYYGLRVDIPVIKLPIIDMHTNGKILYTLSSFSFAISYFVYWWLFLKLKNKGKKVVVYTIDIDNTAYCLIPFLGIPYFSETHTAKKNTFIHRILFSKISGLITINSLIKKEMMERFGLDSRRVIVEPNGVDLEHFSMTNKTLKLRDETRRELGIDKDSKLVLYTGRFFEWKGLEILSALASILGDKATVGIVGGPKEEFMRITKEKILPTNLVFFGEQPYTKMQLWFRVADALIVLGTKRDIQSYLYTSPMKIFEYMTTGTPIIASDTPAIREIVSDQEVVFYEPDNVYDMASKVCYTLDYSEEIVPKTSSAKIRVMSFLWSNRAERILRIIRVAIE